MILALLLTAAAHACDPGTVAELERALDAADVAWDNLDGTALDRAMGRVRELVPAQCAAVERPVVVRVHRAHARHAWTTYDPQASSRAWLAVRDLTPTWDAAADAQVAADHPVREIWHTRSAWSSTLDEQPPGGWWVDGQPAAAVPMDRAFLIQALERDGSASWTGWMLNSSDVPISPWRARRIRALRHRGTVLGAIGLAGATGLIVAGLGARQKVLDPRTPDEDLRRLQGQANTLTGAGAATAALSLTGVGVLWAVNW